jgi:hypothetical protein
LIHLYRALGGGWQIRLGADCPVVVDVPEEKHDVRFLPPTANARDAALPPPGLGKPASAPPGQ